MGEIIYAVRPESDHFWSGSAGENILLRLGEENVYCFCDNYKAGGVFHGKQIIGFSELVKFYSNSVCDVILSVNENSIREQLDSEKIVFWESNDFFRQDDIARSLDDELYSQYLCLNNYENPLWRTENWFRTSYISEKNRQLVLAMESGSREKVLEIISNTYDTCDNEKIYDDEIFENRPGMRMIAQLIRKDQRKEIHVCDLACGHGSFLKELSNKRIKCYGADVSIKRCQALHSVGIECKLGELENSNYENEVFDYVTMMECLEHVQDPFAAMQESYRILKKEGKVLVTVPYGEKCDSDMHVRQFNENDLYSVAKKCGYSDIKIMLLPYMNDTYNDNLIMTAEK